jgi:predicted  nucleic acid-binding Zn-ribbon protein
MDDYDGNRLNTVQDEFDRLRAKMEANLEKTEQVRILVESLSQQLAEKDREIERLRKALEDITVMPYLSSFPHTLEDARERAGKALQGKE